MQNQLFISNEEALQDKEKKIKDLKLVIKHLEKSLFYNQVSTSKRMNACLTEIDEKDRTIKHVILTSCQLSNNKLLETVNKLQEEKHAFITSISANDKSLTDFPEILTEFNELKLKLEESKNSKSDLLANRQEEIKLEMNDCLILDEQNEDCKYYSRQF